MPHGPLEPTPPGLQPDDGFVPRLIAFLSALALAIFVGAAIAAYAGAADVAFVLAALLIVIGVVVVLALTCEDV